jgi:hypothetical protein
MLEEYLQAILLFQLVATSHNINKLLQNKQQLIGPISKAL